MNKLIFLTISLLFFISLNTFAQVNFNTGDAEFNSDLNEINADAKLDFGKFKLRLKANYNISEKKIDYLSAELKMEPAEIYLALEIAKVAGKDIDEVADVYKVHKDKGWGYIAKQMGIKPGSPEFHALKGNAKKTDKRNKMKKEKMKNKNNGKNK